MSELKRTAVTGFLWQAFGSVGQRGAAFVATLVLARFLAKEDFGVVAVALSVVAMLELFRDGGIANAIVVYQGDEERLAPTAFWMLLIPGVILSASVIVAAPYLEQWFGYARLGVILQAMAAAQLLDTFRIVPNSLLGRRHMFRQRAIADTTAVFVAMLVAVISLFVLPAEHQIWSLAMMWIVRCVVAAVVFNIILPVVPRFVFDREIAKRLAKTGSGMLLSNIPSGSLEWVATVIVGKRTSEAAAGMYRVGSSLALPAALIGNSANITLFPILARHRDDMGVFIERALRSMRAVNTLTLAFVGWFVIVAPSLVPFLLGEQWATAVPATQWLVVATALKALTFLCSTPLLAAERNSYAAFTWWVAFGVMLALLPFVPYGIENATTPAMLTAIAMGAGAATGVVMLSVGLKFPPGRVMVALLPGVLIAVATAGVTFGVNSLPLELPDWGRILLVSVAYGLVFLPICGRIMGDGWFSLARIAGWKALLRSPSE